MDAELAQKLVELKFFGEQYDLAVAMMRAARSTQEAMAHWKRSNEYEAKYLEAWDWLISQGYVPMWNKAEQCYQVSPRRT